MKSRNIAYWTCQVLGWGVYSAYGIYAAVTFGHLPLGFRLVSQYSLFFVVIILLTHLLRREIKRRQWLSLPLRKSAPRLAAASILVALISTLQVIGTDLAVSSDHQMWPRIAIIAMVLNLVAACLIWSILYTGITTMRSAIEMRRLLRESQLRALEAQLNPHFLFNSLNTIRGMIVEDREVAQDMVTRLANILRYNLEREKTSTVPLEREIEIVADYLAIESVRFDDRLTVRMEIDPLARDAQVPSMLMQTLVENAVKHGISARHQGGEIVIRASMTGAMLVMEVVNSGQLAPPEAGRTQIGLANARQRLHLLYGDRATLRLENRDRATVAALVSIPA